MAGLWEDLPVAWLWEDLRAAELWEDLRAAELWVVCRHHWSRCLGFGRRHLQLRLCDYCATRRSYWQWLYHLLLRPYRHNTRYSLLPLLYNLRP